MEQQIGSLLQSAPHIAERILRHLSARDIQRVSRVCRLWRCYAKIVLKERWRIVTVTAVKQDHSDTQMNTIDDPETKRFLRDLDMGCGLMIMFQRFNQRLLAFPPDYVNIIGNYETMHSYLPPLSDVIGASSIHGIIGTSMDGSCHEHLATTAHVSAFLIPKLPSEGVHIRHFSLSLTSARKLGIRRDADEIMAKLPEAFELPDDQMIKCIILLATWFVPEDEHWMLIRAIRTVYDGQVALAGGTVNDVYSSAFSPPDEPKRQLNCVSEFRKMFLSNNHPKYVGLIFGGENVRATSLVIKKTTKEEVEHMLKELKAVVDRWGKCKQKIGFMFAYCSRDPQLFGIDDAEAAIFHELMPDIPLNGTFCKSEFGWNYPPEVVVKSAEERGYEKEALHTRTTTIAVVGFV